jgi:pantothenate synthetase
MPAIDMDELALVRQMVKPQAAQIRRAGDQVCEETRHLRISSRNYQINSGRLRLHERHQSVRKRTERLAPVGQNRKGRARRRNTERSTVVLYTHQGKF